MAKKDLSTNEILDKLQSGQMSRRQFTKALGAFGLGLMVSPMLPGRAAAGAVDQATYFTWGGWDDPKYYKTYIKENGEPPNFATFGGSQEAFTKMRAGFVIDVVHACNVEVQRWTSSGLFQPVDTSRLSNWPDVIPELWKIPGNETVDGKPYFVPFEWGQTSIIYRTDKVDLQGKPESWGLLWDERYKKKLAMIASAGDAWWCAAIYAGVPFEEIHTKASLKKVSDLLRKQRPLIRTYTDDPATWEQALASGEIVAAMSWNASARDLKKQGIPVKFAMPKEGALTWVCGLMLHKDAPKPEKAYSLIDSLLSVERGVLLITDEGYGHSNRKSLAAVSDEILAERGLSRNPNDILGAGKFMIPVHEQFEHDSNKLYEEIKAGF